jgi:hypothetical protein
MKERFSLTFLPIIALFFSPTITDVLKNALSVYFQ